LTSFLPSLQRIACCLRWAVPTLGLIAAIAWGVPTASAAAPIRVLLVLSQRSGPYEQTAQALTDSLSAKLPGVDIRRTDANDATTIQGSNDLVVAIGGEATEAVAAGAPKTAILNLLVPRRVHERNAVRFHRPESGQYSAVYLDQPATRQIELIHLAFPTRKRVGVLLGPESASSLPELQAACAGRGLELIAAQAQGLADLPDALRKLSDDADLLLTLPDPAILNANSARNILLYAYRANIPLVAFSPAYVKAGAVLALYSTPQQMGQQGAAAILQWVRNRALPPPQYAHEFEVDINATVARSLNFTLEPASVLADKLRRGSP
jgi:putative ABC transport system substrate-binding protein